MSEDSKATAIRSLEDHSWPVEPGTTNRDKDSKKSP